jgi:putative flavoprotein involved in K+ transport
LPPGAALVVGTGSSGAQIAEELCRSGRTVYLSVGRHLLRPRRYRGRDSFWWTQQMGAFDKTVDTLPAGAAPKRPIAISTGVDGGRDLSPRLLAAQGVQLLGHLEGVRDSTLLLKADLAQTLAAGDASLVEFWTSVDEYIRQTGIEVPRDDVTEHEPPRLSPDRSPLAALDLHERRVTSIVWATGFRYDFGWVHLPIFDEAGEPVHQRGVTACAGVYFLGLRWLYKLKSTFIYGVEEDATYLAEQLTSRASLTNALGG